MTGWEDYRRHRSGLRMAAQAAETGNLSVVDDLVPDVFDSREALAREALQAWWRRLLGRLDGDFGDDLSALPADVRMNAIRRCWADQYQSMAGYLALGWQWPSPALVADRRRYAGLLALFAGLADAADDPRVIARAGEDLVHELQSPEARPVRARRLRRRGRRLADTKLGLLRRSPCFSMCTDKDLVALGRVADLIDADAGTALVADADPGHWWWFVLDGTVEVTVGERPVIELHAGDSLGPQPPGLTRLSPVTLIARTPVEVLVGSRDDVTQLLATNTRLARAAATPLAPQLGARLQAAARHNPVEPVHLPTQPRRKAVS